MVATEKPFLALTADDLMSRDVILIPQDMSLASAANLLSQSRISGAPVVDMHGRCIGVISATDVVRWAGKDREASHPGCVHDSGYVCDWDTLDAEALPDVAVRDYMTGDPVTVPPGTPIFELARRMIDAHIHRVVVTDRERRPVGVVSSTDVLAAVARTGTDT